MAGPLKLSKAYDSPDHAAMGGFQWIRRNGVEWHTNEFGFWIILKPIGQKPTYYYTEPETQGRSTSNESTLPGGVSVVGRCHTHPKSTKTGDFSSPDKTQFLKLRNARPGIAYYLMNSAEQIRRAVAECEFPAGVTVNWDSKITP